MEVLSLFIGAVIVLTILVTTVLTWQQMSATEREVTRTFYDYLETTSRDTEVIFDIAGNIWRRRGWVDWQDFHQYDPASVPEGRARSEYVLGSRLAKYKDVVESEPDSEHV